MTHDSYFASLASELGERAARACVSQIGPRNEALRLHLLDLLADAPGSVTGFLAKPVFEAMFEWESSGKSLSELTLLSESTLRALQRDSVVAGESVEALFPAGRKPYLHQVKAWRALLEPPQRSVLIRTGTSSGKTESFLVPIIDHLARALSAQHGGGPLVGVQALFLYPLNALINSQRDRLLAATAPFNGRLRFCLYNGNTPERSDESLRGPEVRDRRLLRKEPPPVLITNATMLEYLLVRQSDASILQQSSGKLRYIVLDEAHTYLGSAAAELALLLRRVMHGFGVKPEQVRFIATSATIGGNDAEGELKRFLADLAGVSAEQVAVVSGKRVAPALPAAKGEPFTLRPELLTGQGEDLATRLAGWEPFRALRSALNEGPMPLQKIAAALGSDVSDATALALLDAASASTFEEQPLLPLRAHYFMRTLEGIWCCTNRDCPGKSETHLSANSWPWGKVFFSHRDRCDRCESIVAEQVSCRRCGESYLPVRDNQGLLTAISWSVGDDFDDREGDPGDPLDDEDPDETEHVEAALLATEQGSRIADGSPGPIRAFDPRTGNVDLGTGVVRFAGRTESGALRCGVCGRTHTQARPLFRRARLGVNFLLRNALWTVGERMPPSDDAQPARGRRMITFTDSRQGTARHALQSQLEAERTWVRANIYHHLWHETKRHNRENDGEIRGLEQELHMLEALLATNPAVASTLDRTRKELARLRAAQVTSISWRALRSHLSQERTVRTWMADALKRSYAAAELDEDRRAELCLLREFGLRLPREGSLENLGLVKVVYPKLSSAAPGFLRSLGVDDDTWRGLLAFMLESYVRREAPIPMERSIRRWLGQYFTARRLIGPETEAGPGLAAWPTANGRTLMGVVRVLFRALKLDPTNQGDRELLTTALRAAWVNLTESSYLKRYEDGYQLALDELHFSPVEKGYLCPVTGSVLSATARGFSPFATLPHFETCEEIAMPRPPALFGEDQAKTEEWLRHSPEVQDLRRRGVWTEFSDRIVRYGPVLYMGSAEHSAQVPKSSLGPLEKKFKQGNVNVLHCSTTMEMGVDIGGLSGVIMNNTPPAPANYSQRAGRAGRRGEARAVVLTMCPATPHAQAVFRDPSWPFVSKVRPPEVALTSHRIVQRHLQSHLLASFLREQNIADTQTMTCKSFFLPPSQEGHSVCERMTVWLDHVPEEVRHSAEGLLHGTSLAGQVDARLAVAQGELKHVQDLWRIEHDARLQELHAVGGSLDKPWEQAEAPERSVRISLRRLQDEFLLRLLATRGFLPAYGFPLSIVPLVTANAEELEHQRRRRDQGELSPEDVPDPTLGYPTRGLDRALQEYAPGARVLINGTVRESRGVTLNWIAPASQDAREPQSIRWFWRCLHCGEMADSPREVAQCPSCGRDKLRQVHYLEPNGFAVDIREQPHNDARQRQLAQAPSSWVSATGSPWQTLPGATASRYRHSHEGQLFSYVYGASSAGYLVCRHCGYAETMTQRGIVSESFKTHRKLRGGRKNEPKVCPGGSVSYGAWKGIGFGGAKLTDVFELELRDPASGGPLGGSDARRVSTTLAVALREALARNLGIDSRELGFAVRSVQQGDAEHWIVALFDRADGGAGYVAKAVDDLRSLLEGARRVLECAHQCDRLCHGCLLSFDTDGYEADLDRRLALRALSDSFLNTFSLPKEAQVFGPASQFEPLPLQSALALFLQKHGGAGIIRAYWGARTEDWDFHAWPLRPALLALAAAKTQVQIVVSRAVLATLPWDEANVLAAQLEASGFELVEEATTTQHGGMFVALEAVSGGTARRWALSDETGLSPGPTWGEGETSPSGSLRIRADSAALTAVGPAIPWSAIKKSAPAQSAVRQVAYSAGTTLQKAASLLWQTLWKPEAGGAWQPAPGSRLLKVRYSDRYLSSPLAARALHAVLAALSNFGLDRTSELEVRTVMAKPQNDSGFVHANFYGGGIQRQVLEGLARDLVDKVAVQALPSNRDLPHARLLELEWSDGTRLRLGLDQGLGFVETKRRQPFAANAPAAEQVKLLLATPFELAAASTWVWMHRL